MKFQNLKASGSILSKYQEMRSDEEHGLKIST
jgi:hypothetical protein